MKKIQINGQMIGLLAALSCIPVAAQPVNITGTVVDSTTSQGISGALVTLMEYPSLKATTAANGTFTISHTTSVGWVMDQASASHNINLRKERLTVSHGIIQTPINVDVFNIAGSLISQYQKTSSLSGTTDFQNLWQTPGFYFVQVRMNGKTAILSNVGKESKSISFSGDATVQGLGKTAATGCRLEVTASGYSAKQTTVASMEGSAGTIRLSTFKTTVGTWTNVTPGSMVISGGNGGGDNYGVQDIISDPARPTDMYAFVCYGGCWRSTDYGVTWVQVNAGSNWQKPWGAAIDPNPARDPQTSPTLYFGNSACLGFGKSTDFGATWTLTAMPSPVPSGYTYQQVYSVDVNPYDKNHIICGFHENSGIAETKNGGATWNFYPTPPGSSFYPFFINTGNEATTAKSWIAIPQVVADGTGVHTIDGGLNWIPYNKYKHLHGSAEIVSDPDGKVYLGSESPGGVQRSTDYGASFATVALGSVGAQSVGVVTETGNYLYSSTGMGWGSLSAPLNPDMMRAPRNPGTAWTKLATPTGMFDGAKRMAVTYDGTHYILVSGNWHAGIWRYIEP